MERRKFQEILILLRVVLSGGENLVNVSGESEIILVVTKCPFWAKVKILPPIDGHLFDALAERPDSICDVLETLVSLAVSEDRAGDGLLEIGGTHDNYIVTRSANKKILWVPWIANSGFFDIIIRVTYTANSVSQSGLGRMARESCPVDGIVDPVGLDVLPVATTHVALGVIASPDLPCFIRPTCVSDFRELRETIVDVICRRCKERLF